MTRPVHVPCSAANQPIFTLRRKMVGLSHSPACYIRTTQIKRRQLCSGRFLQRYQLPRSVDFIRQSSTVTFLERSYPGWPCHALPSRSARKLRSDNCQRWNRSYLELPSPWCADATSRKLWSRNAPISRCDSSRRCLYLPSEFSFSSLACNWVPPRRRAGWDPNKLKNLRWRPTGLQCKIQ